MNVFDCLIEKWYLWVPLMILLIYWVVIKVFIRIKPFVAFIINIIPLLIALFPITAAIKEEVSISSNITIAIYYAAVAILQFIIDQYRKLLPKTKDSYKFNKQYDGIQNQWDSIENNNVDIKVKSSFVEESLKSIAMSITHPDVQMNQVTDKKVKDFAKTAGTVPRDYILLCSNQNVIFNRVFAWLYKYLFEEYKKKVLSPIQSTSTGTVDLIIPEFVSNGLTQAIINNESSVQYQHNTSVVNSLSEFENNVEVGTELKGNIEKIKRKKNNFLQRIIINDEFKEDNQKALVEKIIKWHEKSYVDLKFIFKGTAENIMKKYSTIGRLDFSVIKMVNESEYFILGADKLPNDSYFAGQNHEMYAVKCTSSSEEPENDKLFDELWNMAERGTPMYKNGQLISVEYNT